MLYDPAEYEWQTIKFLKRTHERVHHWSQVPEEDFILSGWIVDQGAQRRERLKDGGYRDYGLDGLVKTEEGRYIGVQAKAYGPDSTVTFKKLGTFLGGRDFLVAKNPENACLLVHTPETKFEGRLAVALRANVLRNVSAVELEFSEPVQPVDENESEPVDNESWETRLELYPHQERAISDLLNVEYKHGLYVSPCGSGKTVVAGRFLASARFPLIVVASPLQSSASQNMDRLKQFLPGYKTVKAWSNAHGTDLAFIESGVGEGVNVLVSTTFDTLPVVVQALKNLKVVPFVLVDEAHNLPSYKDESDEANDALWQSIYYAHKSLLMTATPSIEMTEKSDDVKIVHRYKFGDAIRDQVITDYKIFIPELTTTADVPVEIVGDAETVAKACFLVSGMLESGARRCIVYCESKEACRLFNESFASACGEYFGVKSATFSVTCDNSDADRKRILKHFANDAVYLDPDPHSGARQIVLSVVSSVRILDEAVDIPQCDSVFISRLPKSNSSTMSATRAVQRLCRAVRIHPSKTTAKAFVWTDPNDCAGIIKTFKLLRENDPDFVGKFKCVANNYDKKHDKEAIKRVAMTLEEFKNAYVVKAVDVEENWEAIRALVIEYEELFPGKLNSFTIYKGVKIGVWRMNQRKNYVSKKASMTADKIAKLEAIPRWRWTEDEFEKRMSIYHECLDSLGEDDEIPNEYKGHKIHRWLRDWKAHYRNKDKDGHNFFDNTSRLRAFEDLLNRIQGRARPDKTHALVDYITSVLKPKHANEPDYVIVVPVGTIHMGHKIGEWVGHLRSMKKQGRIKQEYVDYIAQHVPDFPWERPSHGVAKFVKMWNQFKQEKGHPPTSNTVEYVFGKGETYNFKNAIMQRKADFNKNKLSEEEIDALNALEGFSLHRSRSVKRGFAESAEEYMKEHSKGGKPDSNSRLGKWLMNQKAKLAPKRDDPDADDETKAQIATLESLPDFKW